VCVRVRSVLGCVAVCQRPLALVFIALDSIDLRFLTSSFCGINFQFLSLCIPRSC
jgi:hypothetical protein